MRRFIRERLPDPHTLLGQRWLRPLHRWLQHPRLWQLHRRSVAGGVALGLFCGLIPGPLQMLAAALLAVWLRVNLPVALVTTLYTNPFTIVPLYLVAYRIGVWASGVPAGTLPVLGELRWDDGFASIWAWLQALGKPLLIGLPLLALGLAVAGYLLVRVLWRMAVLWQWHRRHLR